MLNTRTKKRNKLTTDREITELAYIMHLAAQKIRHTAIEVNIPAAYRLTIERKAQWLMEQAKSLGKELNIPNADAFLTKESTEKIAEQLGLFK